jgi:formylglycine-generating enzyme required for sulfatase activity
MEALKQRLAEAENTSKDYLDKLKKAKAAIDRSKAKRESEKQAMAVREDERRKMRETLMGLKDSLAAKNSELERTRAHAEEAAQMRERLARMDKLLSGDEKGTKQNRPSETELAFNEELSRQEERHGSLENELSDALNRLDDIESERSKSEDLKKRLEAAQLKQERAIERISELQAAEQPLQQQLAQIDQRIKDLAREIEHKSASGDAASRREAGELRNQLEAARMEQDGVKSKVAKLAEEHTRTQNELEESGAAISNLQSELDKREQAERAQEEEYKRTLSALESQLEEVKSSQETAERSAKAMEEERARMASELESARAQLKEVEAKAGGQVEELQRQLDDARKQAEKGKDGGAGSEKQREAMRRMEALQKQLQKQQQELKRSESEREGLKEFLESRSGELHDLKRALTDAQVEAEEADFRRQEAEEARRQVEDALSRLHDQVEHEKAKGTVTYDEEGNEYVAPRKSKTGLVVTLLMLAIAGGGGGYWFMNQGSSPKPRVTQQPTEQPEGTSTAAGSETATATDVTAGGEGGQTADGQPDAPEKEPEVVDHSGEPATGTPYREALADGGEAPALSYIRGGEFTMGNLGDPWMQEENPSHHVRVTSFYMGTYEVTFAEYDAFANATRRRKPDDAGMGRGDRPVINVNHADAVAYTEWLTEQTGATYRLPSEAEWEYAARGDTKTDFWWGNSIGLNRANCFNCSSKWDGKATAPVGTFKPNPYGLFNTAGNVMEWTQDCYNPSYRNAPGDGGPWLEGDCQLRVVRGSAYNRPAQSMRNSKRTGMDKDEFIPIIGFRVVREVNAEE